MPEPPKLILSPQAGHAYAASAVSSRTVTSHPHLACGLIAGASYDRMTNGANDWWQRLRERGVVRVAASYAVIAWLLLQIADVTFDPLGVPRWVMVSLIVAAVVGFPVAIALAWFYEVGDHGVELDTARAGTRRPIVHGWRRYADVVVI